MYLCVNYFNEEAEQQGGDTLYMDCQSSSSSSGSKLDVCSALKLLLQIQFIMEQRY